jgi:hypothetical protein
VTVHAFHPTLQGKKDTNNTMAEGHKQQLNLATKYYMHVRVKNALPKKYPYETIR